MKQSFKLTLERREGEDSALHTEFIDPVGTEDLLLMLSVALISAAEDAQIPLEMVFDSIEDLAESAYR